MKILKLRPGDATYKEVAQGKGFRLELACGDLVDIRDEGGCLDVRTHPNQMIIRPTAGNCCTIEMSER